MTSTFADEDFDSDGYYKPRKPEPLTNPVTPKLLTTDQLDGIPEPTWIIDNVLASGSMTWIAGAPGAYKSFLAIDWACAVSLGVNTCGGNSTKTTPVIYMAGEGVGGLRARVQAWHKATGLKPAVMWLPEAIQIGKTDWMWLRETTKELAAGLVVIDTYARSTIGLKEIDGAEQGIIGAHMDAFRAATGSALLGVHHHSAAGKTLRGHTSLEGSADKIVTLTKDDNGIATMCHYKQKDTEPYPDEYYRASPNGKSITLTATEQPETVTESKRKRT